LNSNRSALGAIQNRLQSTINNISIYRENLEAARSRIKDTDMATETSELTKNNILSQAGISVLGQANQNPQMALKLLG
jgi:flagellin